MSQPQLHGVRELRIGLEQAGQRIDNFLLTQLKGVPKSHVYRILRRGEVRVNGGRIRPEYRLQPDDRLRLPPMRTADRTPTTAPGATLQQRIADAILYEDNRYLILNKPSGVAVHGGSGVSFGVIETLRALRPQAPFLELGHRLDRDTSGCLLLAKRRSALRAFQELLRSGGVEKHYLALVRGAWQGGSRYIDLPLQRSILRSGERMVHTSDSGKAARSRFVPLTYYRDATLMRVTLITGRTHQVRVHAAASGHPLAGDEKYGDAAFNRLLRQSGLKRLFLHAEQLRFTPPEQATLALTAPLEASLQSLLQQLEASL